MQIYAKRASATNTLVTMYLNAGTTAGFIRLDLDLVYVQAATDRVALLVVDAKVGGDLHWARGTLGDVAKGPIAEDRTARAAW